MPAIVDNLTLAGNAQGQVAESSGLITATGFQTRRAGNATYAFEDLGAGAIQSGAWHRAYFEISAIANQTIIVPIMTGNAAQDRWQFWLGVQDESSIFLHDTGVITWWIEHIYGITQIEFVNKVFGFLLNNRYAVDKIRSGQSVTGNLYDIDGGHGTPGALVDTQTLNCAQTLLDHSHRFAVSGSADGGTNNSATFETALWDMNAGAGSVIPPAVFQAGVL